MQHQQRTFDFDVPRASCPNREEEPVCQESEQISTTTSLPPPPLVRPDRQVIYEGAHSHFAWPDAKELHDRDTITVDRVTVDIDGPPHRFVIKRGDTVEAFLRHDKFLIGEVTGISHARSEVRVASDTAGKGGVWFAVGAIYPHAIEEEPKSRNLSPLSAVVAKVNAKHSPEGGFTEADRVLASYTFGEFKELVGAGLTSLSYKEYQETFRRIINSKEDIEGELKATYKAGELKQLAARFGVIGAKGNNKQQNAKAIYRRMLGYFSLGQTVSYGMKESFEEAISKQVEGVTKEEWSAYVEKRHGEKAAHEEALENPQDLADFRKFIDAKGVSALSDEQLSRWDTLHAELTRERRSANGPSKTVTAFENENLADIEFTMKEGYHDKRECSLWIVSLGSRVESSAFKELKTKAKMLGGWWSSFKKSDAGFQFLEKEAAEKFASLLAGDVDRTEQLHKRKQHREETAAERLHRLADDMLIRSELTIERSESLLQNTERRARIQAGVRGEAYAEAALGRTLHSVANALSSGEALALPGIRHRTHIETLERTLRLARWERIKALKKEGVRVLHDEEEQKPITEADVRFAKYPYPQIYARSLHELVEEASGKRGVTQAARKIKKYLPAGTDLSGFLYFQSEYDIKKLFDFDSRCKFAGLDTERISAACAPYQRLQAASIENIHELRCALREYLPHRAETRGDDPVKIAERELIGMKLPGFFPTPRAVIEEMLSYAELEPGHHVLEPSCGKGDIVKAILAEEDNLQVRAIERNHTLAEVLSAKELVVEFGDFLEHEGKYDRVVMNPPFEQGADIEHVRHAYSCLKPGGILVSVMSEGSFQRSDKKAVQFQRWYGALGGWSVKLPEDAFKGVEAFRQTGVRTRIAVLHRHKEV